MPFILLVVLAWPFLEIAAFIYVGARIGILPTIALTLLSSFAGVILLRVQGIALLQRLRAELGENRIPAADLGHGAFIAFAGLCLLVPGFLSDIVGLLLFLPPVRHLILLLLTRNMTVVVKTTSSRAPIVDLDPHDWRDSTGNPDRDHTGPDAPRPLPGPPQSP